MMKRLQVSWSGRSASMVRFGAVICAVTLSGCVDPNAMLPVWPNDVKRPPAIKQETLSYLVARSAADNCRSLSIRPEAQQQLHDRIVAMYRDGGVAMIMLPDISTADIISGTDAYEQVETYRIMHDIKKDDEAGWCAAGNSEMAHKTQIGSFLKKTI